MKVINLMSILFMLILSSGCSQNTDLDDVEFLIGTWKMEGEENYEAWKKNGDELVGESYNVQDGQKIITEKIQIKMVNGQLIYTPTVFDQNDGKGIPFTLKSSEQELFSFENPDHDFPKKIQYQILKDNELFVSVLGENDEGFSYKLMKQVD